jgi:nucleoside-diphosphate-sugar epimerase
MKALVTGGCGFIGSHLVDALRARGDEVCVIDDLSSPVRHVSLDAGVTYHALDVREALGSPPAPALHGPGVHFDWAFSLASPVSVQAFMSSPMKTIATNVASALLCCQMANEGVVFVSSTDAYGQRYPTKLTEQMASWFRPQLPRFAYGIAKLAGEAVTLDRARRSGDAWVARLFKTFGPRMGLDGRMASVFICNAVRGDPLEVYIGSQVSAPCYVDDIVRGLLAFIRRPRTHVPLNLGSPRGLTVLEFAQMVVRVTRSTSAIVRLPMPLDRPNDPPRRVPDIRLAKKLLDWEPLISLEEGIRLTAESFGGTP